MVLVIKRDYFPNGANSDLFIDGKFFCKAIELPWANNLQGKSCIPEGCYLLRKRYSIKFKWHFEIANVPNRKYILIHPANDAKKELRGCIAPVLQHTGEGKGSSSRAAFERLKNVLYPILDKGTQIQIHIIKKEVQ